MGRIKSLMVKRAAKQLVAVTTNFNESFSHNKKLLGRTMPSKPIRNKVAGYIARIIRAKNTEKAREAAKTVQPKREEA